MRGLKYNASRNNLRHAIQCLPWDWAAKDPPAEIDWPQLTMCVASDLVYYEESSGQNRTLARVMRLVLERSRPSLRFLMINRLRVQDGNRLVLPKAPAPGEEDVDGEDGRQRRDGRASRSRAPSPRPRCRRSASSRRCCALWNERRAGNALCGDRPVLPALSDYDCWGGEGTRAACGGGTRAACGGGSSCRRQL